jgi:flagellar protein FlaG
MRIETGVKDVNYAPQTIGTKRTEAPDAIKLENTNLNNQKIQHMQAEQAQEQKQEINEHEVIQAIERANKHIRTYDRRLEFSIHEQTKQIMVKVINTENDSVIREIPSEKILDMVAHLWEVAGILVDEKR